MLDGLSGRKKREPRRLEDVQKEAAQWTAEMEAKYPELRRESEAREQAEKQKHEEVVYKEAAYDDEMRNIAIENIRDLKEPLEHIVEELAGDLEQGAYSIIIGDDAAGRIPTIMIGKIAHRIAERNGHTPPIVRFLAGSTGLAYSSPGNIQKRDDDIEHKTTALKDQVAKMISTAGQNGLATGRILIMTDSVSTGESVEYLITAVRANGWDADVATIGIPEGVGVKKIERLVAARLVVGTHDMPMIYNDKELTGVTKDRTELFAKPHPTADPDRIRFGRRKAKELAQEIFEEYEKGRTA